VTLDARKGRLVKVTLNGQPVTDFLDARVCAGDGVAQVEGFQPGGGLYVVPSSSRAFSSSYIAVGHGAVVSGLVSSGVPSALGGAWTTSRLAKLTLTVRSGEMISDDTALILQPQGAGNTDCQTDLWGPVTDGQAPYRATTLVSPGTWDVRTDDSAVIGNENDQVGGYFVNRAFAAGHTYDYTYYMAAWAPQTSLAELRPSGISYTEPTFADPSGNGSQAAEKYAFALSVNGHLITRKSTTDWGNGLQGYFISTRTAGWYTLTDDVTRYRPGLNFAAQGTLSPRVTFAFHFYARPATITASDFPLIAGFGIKMVPEQLTLRNLAAPASKTTVVITPFRPVTHDGPSPADSVTKIQAWSLADGGNWTALKVSRSSGGYTVAVQNPGSGHISLRVTVTGSHGDTSTETIYRAYGIS
jgi:hypothetical protein